jgi:hypothetical protein
MALMYDLCRIMCTALLMFDNDASVCFDQIMVSLATIVALRLVFPCPAARMHSMALKCMMYFINTAHGISEAFYKVTKQYLLFGTGQGSGASPVIWLTIVVYLLSALMAMAPMAMQFTDPWGYIFDE